MTSILEGRDDLAALLAGAGVKVTDAPGGTDPPLAVVFLGGVDPDKMRLDGSIPCEYRIVCVASAWEQEGAARSLAELVASVMAAVIAAAGWTFGRVTGARTARVGGADRLAADVFATTTIHL